MPKEKELTRCIPKIYKYNAENIMLFAWVTAQKQAIPTITLHQSIRGYFKFINASFEDWDIESAIATFGKLQKAYYEDCKS
jgi:hypothetical protein